MKNTNGDKNLKRLQYDKYGGPEVVRLTSFPLPPPGEDEVMVQVAAASINPMDWKLRSGAFKIMTGSKFPRAIGTDFAGTVEAVGSKVSRFKPGDGVARVSRAFRVPGSTSQRWHLRPGHREGGARGRLRLGVVGRAMTAPRPNIRAR
jgi:NADPH:quinone reductase-like Zn-dependent oxidoreductase